MTILDDNYVPPAHDPSTEGLKHWDTLRQQYMLLKDALRTSENEHTIKDRRISDLQADIERLTKLREADRNECVSLRTTLQNLGSMLVNGLRKAEADRLKTDPYAPPATPSEPQGEDVPQEDKDALESLLGRVAKQNTGRAAEETMR